jgi:predicted ATPase/class 3 adenylate cyclase
MDSPWTQPERYVFLSYSSSDRDRALQIADLLDANGITAWIDRRGIAGGTNWSQEIVQAIEGCAVVLLLCSTMSMTSRNVRQEVQLAWESNRPILPLLLEPVQMTESIRYAVAGRQWLELFGRSEGAWIGDALQALARLDVRPNRSATGAATPVDTAQETRCPACNAPVQPGQRFCPNCGTALDVEQPSGVAVAERRTLSILIVDFLPSAERDKPLDPEDFAAALGAARRCSLDELRRYGVTPAEGSAQRLTAYFGLLATREDDTFRAVKAALDVVSAVDRLPRRDVQARAAIHTGLVVVEYDAKSTPVVSGVAPTVATAMLEMGEPGTVVASQETHRLVEGYFRVSDLGQPRIHGRPQPLQMFQIIEENPAHSRLDVAASRGLTPLVGRQAELALLLERWERACDGDGQVVLLIGDPGIGKSRLSRDFGEVVSADSQAWIIPIQCAEIHEQTPFQPIVELFERQLLNFSPRMTIEDRRAAIQTYIDSTNVDAPNATHLLSSLLNIPIEADDDASIMPPDRLRHATVEWLISLVLARAEQEPVLVQCEDLQWADPSTLELLSMLIEYCPSATLMVVVTSRPGLVTNWLSRTHVTTVNLTRLSNRQSAELIGHVTGAGALSPTVVDQVANRGDGVPLFLEELTRLVLDSGNASEPAGQDKLTAEIAAGAIPATLHDLLHARLDELGDIREVAQLGATIGREFSFEFLNAVSNWDESSLRHALARLSDANVIQQRGLPSQATYMFRHSLVRDAAYGSLGRERRQQFHRQAAQALVERFPDTASSRPELVAHHFTEAGDVQPAIQWWFRAGQRAVQTSANLEAIAHLTRGLALLDSVPDGAERMQVEMGMQMTLGVALMTTQGFAAADVQTAFQRAYDLCQIFGDVPEVIPALHGLWTFYIVRAELDTAHQIAEDLLRLSERAGDDGLVVQSLLSLGTTNCFMGEIEAARSSLERALAIYDPALHAQNAYIFGHEPGTSAMSYLSISLWLLGYPDLAFARSREGIELGRSINHPLSFSRSLSEAALLHSLAHDIDGTDSAGRTAIDYSTEHGVVLWAAVATAFLGWAAAAAGDPSAGIELMQQGIEGYQATGALLGMTHLLMCLAEVHRFAGDDEAALAAVERAIERAMESGERYVLAESQRVKADVLLHQGKTEAAEQCLRDALATARDQQARSFELRASTDLARLWHARGEETSARELLQPLLGSFSEGHDLGDYRNAFDLLGQITS